MRITTRIAALVPCVVLGASLAVPTAGATGGSAPATRAAPVIVNRPLLLAPRPASVSATWSSSNWSGYAETGTYTGISSAWTVPTVLASASATYSSTWVGIDGFTNSQLIQVGTEQDFSGGRAHYDAWWEVLPAPESVLSPTQYPVAPGDRMKASICERAATTSVTTGTTTTVEHLWTIVVADVTRGWTFTTTRPYNGPGASAEWMHEAPLVNGAVSNLARYSVAAPASVGDFDHTGIRHNVVPPGVVTPSFLGAALNYGLDAGIMVQHNVTVSRPSGPDAALTAFNHAYGALLPAKPVG
jgi:hypothetical protein